MERLTNRKEAEAQQKSYDRRIRQGYPRNIPEERFLRLAAWESLFDDTGLTPDELPRAAELYKAWKEGRCVLVPCKKGDVLWSFFNYPARAVCSMRVLSVSTVDGKTVIRAEKYGTFPASDIGKTVFLTRAEAETALGGGGDGE